MVRDARYVSESWSSMTRIHVGVFLRFMGVCLGFQRRVGFINRYVSDSRGRVHGFKGEGLHGAIFMR
ncbi:hypothetical protein QJS10_CPA03g00092 [Acorus calamus]|uniref:Uncharacterized protein n=1 Tax=Acorus calamus TaxID=4465 RepID=A0AAV9F775_ACOCL|nr:hypothetical protein QJS10_CPA03g00092 [Acorus calamus]